MRKLAKLIIAFLAAILPCGTVFAQTDENIVDITDKFTQHSSGSKLTRNSDGSITFIAQKSMAELYATIYDGDWTGYKSLTFEFSSLPTADFQICVCRSNRNDVFGQFFRIGSQKFTIEFGVNDTRKVSEVYLRFAESGVCIIKRIYLTKTNFDANKIKITPGPGKVTSLKDFTLDFGGQEVSVNNEIKARLGEGLGDITQKSDGNVEIKFAEMVKPGSYQLQVPYGAIIFDTRPIGELLYNYTIDNFSKLQVNEGTKTTMLKESGKEEYYQKGVQLKKGDQLHAFYCSDKEWMRAYPVDGGLKIEADGTYDVYFIPGEGRLYVEAEETEATIKVNWNDAGNEAGKRPESLTYKLSGNGNATGKEVTLNEECSWTVTLTKLPTMESNKPIEYTWSVKESLPEEYVLMDESTVDTKTTLVYGLMTVTLSETSATYDGTDVKPTVTVKLGDKVIGKDEYMVKYMVDGEEVTECIESGEYTVVVSDKEGGKYTLNETTLTFIVVRNKVKLVVVANPKTIYYRDDPSNAGVTYRGFLEGDDPSVLSGTLRFKYNSKSMGTGVFYTSDSPTGTYYIIPRGLTSDTYDIEFKAGKLTVKPRNIYYRDGTLKEDEEGYTLGLQENGSSATPIPMGDGNLKEVNYIRTLAAPGAEGGDVEIDGEQASLYTVCLPFAPLAPTEAVKYYTLGSVSDTTLDFEEVTEPEANTPYLVAVTGSEAFKEQFIMEPVTSMEINSKEVDGFTFTGTYTGIKNADAIGKYVLQSKNRWGKVADDGKVYIPPFRAYIEGPADGARLLKGSIDGETTGIWSIRTKNADGSEQWYDLNGRRIERPTQKGLFIRNGRKEVTK